MWLKLPPPRISAGTNKLKFVTPCRSGVASFSLPTSAGADGKLQLATQKNVAANAAARISADTDKLKFVTPCRSGVASFSLPSWLGTLCKFRLKKLAVSKNAVAVAAGAYQEHTVTN